MNYPGASRDLTPSDIPNARFSWLLVTTTSGSVVYESEGGNITTLASVPVGVWIPMGSATNVRTSSTAVGFTVA